MRLDHMLPYLVTLGFLAIWALAHIFNREGESLPPRAVRPPGGPGPRPQPAAGAPRRTEPPMRWSTAPTPAAPGRPAGARAIGLDDDIVILEVEPARRAPTPNRAGTPATGKRSQRGRTSASAATKRSEPVAAKVLGSPLAPLSVRPIDVKPLRLSQESLTTLEPPTKPALGTPAEARPAAPAPGLDGRMLAATPDRLRQAFILSEIFRPPLALRSRSG